MWNASYFVQVCSTEYVDLKHKISLTKALKEKKKMFPLN